MAKPADVAGTFFVKEKGGIREYKLGSNDLQILLAPDPSMPVAASMVTYRVGSRNEAVGHTGATHLLEHLMFKGSENFNKDNGNDVWHELQSRGALMNATTWLDRTNYYEVVPKEHMHLALAIEADRMRHAFLREADRANEMTVVRNEFERGENDPREALDKQIWAAMFLAHPYHHSTIGWRSDIETMTIERLRQFYDEFYWPNNATVTVAGDFDEKTTLQTIVETFGRIERSPKPIPEMLTTEPPQEGARRVIVSRKEAINMVGVGYAMPEGLHSDMPAIVLASLILGAGNTSRFHKAFIDTALASDLYVHAMPFRDPSPFITYVTLAGEETHEDMEKRIKAQYAKLAKTPPSAAEMQIAKRLYRSSLASRRDGPEAFIGSINEDIARGDWTLFLTFPEALERVTPRDVSRVVQKYLIDESKSTIGYFIGHAPPRAKVAKKRVQKQKRRPAFRMPRSKALKKKRS